MLIQNFLNENLIFTNLKPASQMGLFQFLYDQAKQEDFVTDDFLTRLIQREENFPTGLKLGGYNVALPHTDAECVKKEFIAIATLSSTVPFQLMENRKEQVDVSLVFMLGLNNPHNQLEVLKELVRLIQDQTVVSRLVAAASNDEITDLLKTEPLKNK